jgi:hypothetical protein
MHPNGKRGRTTRDPIEIMDTLLSDAAEQAAEDYEPTADDEQWARDTLAALECQLAELREHRGAQPSPAQTKRRVAIPAEMRTLNRAAVIAKIEELRRRGGVAYAFDNKTDLSDNDLRGLLATLQALVPERD